MKAKKRYAYPAIFTPHDADGGYGVYFPDLEINTDGESAEDALYMAADALGGVLCVLEDEGEAFPQASEAQAVAAPKGGFVSLVMTDSDEYRKKYDQTLVKKTVNIPRWLNEKGQGEGLNFSQLLTDALYNELGINR